MILYHIIARIATKIENFVKKFTDREISKHIDDAVIIREQGILDTINDENEISVSNYHVLIV